MDEFEEEVLTGVKIICTVLSIILGVLIGALLLACVFLSGCRRDIVQEPEKPKARAAVQVVWATNEMGEKCATPAYYNPGTDVFSWNTDGIEPGTYSAVFKMLDDGEYKFHREIITIDELTFAEFSAGYPSEFDLKDYARKAKEWERP